MTKKELESVQVSDSIGSVSIEETKIKKPKAVMVLAHGAGAGMHHPFMKALAEGLGSRDIEAVRFNFPFVEQKKKRPDVPAVAVKTIDVLSQYAHQKYPELPLFLAGKSFGGRMASHALAKHCPPYVTGLVFYGFPLHAPGKPSVDRADHLAEVKCPMLFLQGTRDSLATFSLIEEVAGKIKGAALVKFENADHSFKSGKKVFLDELIEATDEWIGRLL